MSTTASEEQVQGPKPYRGDHFRTCRFTGNKHSDRFDTVARVVSWNREHNYFCVMADSGWVFDIRLDPVQKEWKEVPDGEY